MPDPKLTPSQIAALPYRPCVGVVLVNCAGKIFGGERIDTPGAWQMPQGGIDPGEAPREAAFRELLEETGVTADQVTMLGETPDWITYDLPHDIVPRIWKGRFRGQQQRWFLMRFEGDDSAISIAGDPPEFSDWTWLSPPDLIAAIVPFKREVYAKVLAQFAGQLTLSQ